MFVCVVSVQIQLILIADMVNVMILGPWSLSTTTTVRPFQMSSFRHSSLLGSIHS
jgi:hypothetical protein